MASPRTGAPRPRRAALPALPALTGVRFIAAAQIVAFHYAPVSASTPAWLRSAVKSGYLGVGFFFVLSGFILAYSYLDDESTLATARRDFWSARVARIYPVYALGLLLALPAFVARAAADPATGSPAAPASAIVTVIASAPLLAQSWFPVTAMEWNYPSWSLSCEAFFYLLFPWLAPMLARLARRRPFAVMLACWSAALTPPALYLVARPDGLAHVTSASWGVWLSALKYDPALRLPEFAFGIALGAAFVERGERWRERARFTPGLSFIAVGAMVAGGAFAPYPLLHNGLLAPAFGLAIMMLAVAPRRGIVAMLSTAPARRLGEASFAMYVLHAPLHDAWVKLLAVVSLDPPPWTAFALYAGVVVASSIAVSRRIEEPARRAIVRALRRERSRVEARRTVLGDA
jgi:peptidoglycan/LPS O-acetylase OafA/YrhL